MTKIYTLFLFFALFTFRFQVLAQGNEEKKVTGDFVNLTFDDFVKTVEAQTQCRFFYDQKRFDSLQVTMRVTAQPLQAVLRELFKDTDFNFAIDRHSRVFVYEGQQIVSALPPGYFDPSYSDASQQESTVYKVDTDDERGRILAAAEKKEYDVGVKSVRRAAGNSTVSGFIRNGVTGEPVIGAAVYIESPSIGTATDALGHYSIVLPRGKHLLKVRSFGMRDTYRQIALHANGKLDIEMLESVIALKEVSIKHGVDANVSSTQMGQVKLTVKNLKQIPTVFGETDILRSVLTLPGVKTVSESSVGLNVRGGSADQNLMLYNDVTIFNPAHLFGFFSAFNPDVLKDVELYKSAVPSRLGGRLSSVLDINGRDGNKKKYQVTGGLGLVTGRLAVEGPIVKDKSSFILAGRSTYSGWLLKQLDNEVYKNSSGSFYDVNLHVNHEINKNNSITLTGYLSDDRFKLMADTIYSYKNQLLSLKWKHTFNSKLYGTVTASNSRYEYKVEGTRVPLNSFDLTYDINQTNGKLDFIYNILPKHTLEFGLSTNFYKLNPGRFRPKHPESLIIADTLEQEQALESVIYLEDKFEITKNLSVSAGIRFSLFNYLGPKTVYEYAPGLPIDDLYTTGSRQYGRGKFIKNYGGPEYRLALRYTLKDNSSLKVSFNTMRQYLHLLSNTMTISPTDIWKLSDSYLKPQLGDQTSVGWYKNILDNKVEFSVEGYYRNIRNFLDYKSGDSLIMNHQIESAVISTIGKAYGVEFLIKKMTGKLNGWIGYTYSRSLLRATDVASSDAPNKGNFYPSNYDKPHDLTVIANYKLSHRFNVSMNFLYSTGRPYTPPVGKYMMDGSYRVFYAERNQFRIPDYYRVDLSVNIEGNHLIKKLAHSSWTVAVFNLLGRRNPSSVFFQTRDGRINGYKLSIFGQPIPTLTYNFRF